MGLVIYSVLVLLSYFGLHIHSDNHILNLFGRTAFQWLMDFKSVPNAFIAIAVFYFFLHTKIKNSRAINYAARPAFAVYIVHQSPVIWPWLWTGLFQTNEWTLTRWFIPMSIITVIAVYVGASLIDTVRAYLFENKWLESRFCSALSRKLDNFAK